MWGWEAGVYLFTSSFPFQKIIIRRKDNYKVENEWSNLLSWIFSFSCIIHIFWLDVGSTSWMLILMLAAVCPLPPVSLQENISGVHLFSNSWFRGVAGLSLLYLLIGSIPCAFKVCGAKKFSDLEWTPAALLPGVYKPQGTWSLISCAWGWTTLVCHLLSVNAKAFLLGRIAHLPPVLLKKNIFLRILNWVFSCCCLS